MNKSNRKKLVWGSYFDEAPATPPATPATPPEVPATPAAPAAPAPAKPAPAPAPAADLVPKAELDKALADKATLEKQLADAKKETPVPNPAEKPATPAASAPEVAAPVDAVKLLAEMDAKLKASELKNFKLNALRDAGGELFPELVSGDSEEAILESITKSKAKYQEVFEKGKAAAAAAAPAAGNPAATPATPEPGSPAPAVPTAIRPEAANAQELSFESIQAMSNDDYAKNRDRIKSEMSGFKYQGM